MSRTSSPSTGRAYGLARVLAAEFVAGAPEIVMQGDYLAPNNGRPYSVSSDGQRFLMIKDATIAGDSDVLPPQVNIVLNWTSELLERVPVPSIVWPPARRASSLCFKSD